MGTYMLRLTKFLHVAKCTNPNKVFQDVAILHTSHDTYVSVSSNISFAFLNFASCIL